MEINIAQAPVSPQVERSRQRMQGRLVIPTTGRTSTGGGEPAEPEQIQLILTCPQHIAGTCRGDPPIARSWLTTWIQRTPQVSHVSMDDIHGGCRSVISPHGVDDLVPMHRSVAGQQQRTQHGPRLARTEINRDTPASDHQRAKHPELCHHRAFSQDRHRRSLLSTNLTPTNGPRPTLVGGTEPAK